MARQKSKGTELDVLIGKAARANLAIFDALTKESPQNIKQLRKKVSKHKGLEETYYASLTKRLHRLQETGYVTVAKPTGEGAKTQTYELTIKAYLAAFLKENSMQDILDQATDTQAAFLLLTLLNVSLHDKQN